MLTSNETGNGKRDSLRHESGEKKSLIAGNGLVSQAINFPLPQWQLYIFSLF